MSGSIVTFEKPIKHLGLADWHAHTWGTQQTANTRRADTFELRHQARQLRNETRIKTEWDTYHNDVRLADRITELGRWKETLEEQLKRIESDIKSLTDEKAATERELDFLDIHLSIINECITARDARGGSELTYDDADTELKKELCVVEGIKQMLIDRCQSCWEKINRLEEVKFKVQLDINDKSEAIEIDKDMLTLDKHCTGISFKPDPLGVPRRSISHQNWLEHSRYTKLLADNELADTAQMREALFIVRERARNNLKAQRETADYALRKRIYEIQRSKNEVQWQGLQMKEEMQSTLDEIIALEAAFQDKTDAIKLAETRLQSRAQRPGYEASRDEPEMGIRDELTQLLQTRKDLADKIDCAKATYNALEDLQVKLNEGLENKNHALMTDLRCLDLRARLKTEEGTINTETQRNIVLTKMEKEIPPT